MTSSTRNIAIGKQLVLSLMLALGPGAKLVVRPTAAQPVSQQQSQVGTRPLSPEVQSQIKKMLDATAAIPPGGMVRGFVEAKAGNLEILLPNVKVFIRRADTNAIVPQSSAVTDLIGRFRIPRQATGAYLVCAEAQGFEAGCSDEKTEVSGNNVALNLPIALKPLGGVIGGRALLRNDGKAAAAAGMAIHSSSSTAVVSLFDAAGKRLAGPVATNAAGYYVMTNIKPGTNLELRVRFQGGVGNRRLSLTKNDLMGNKPFDILVQGSASSRRANRAAFAPTGNYSPPAHSGPFIDPISFMGCANEAACEMEANNYYQTIGVFDSNNHPTATLGSLSAWKSSFGFSADPTKPAADETRAVYYNNADLKLGRDMHCIGPRSGPNTTIWACYVTNFDDGHFESDPLANPAGGDPQTSITRAESSTSPIATVAMVSAQLTVAPFTNSVSFYVYLNKGNPDGQAVTNAALDSEGLKAVPGVCIACHGGTYDNTKHLVVDGRFLPFDTPSFIFDNQSNAFIEPAQREAFRQLNQVVKAAANTSSNTITRDTIFNLIDGWYGWCGGVLKPGCYIDDEAHPFVPSANCNDAANAATCGWTNATLRNFSFDSASFYQQVPRVYCRTCHVAHSDLFNVQSFAAVSSPGRLQQIASVVFSRPFMPYAQVPYNGFWFDFPSQNALRAFVGLPPITPGSALTSWVQSDDGPHVVYADASGHLQQFWQTIANPIATPYWSFQDLKRDQGAPLVGSSSALTSWVQSDDGPHVVYADANGHLLQFWYIIATKQWVAQDLTTEQGAPLVGKGGALTSWVQSDGPHVVYADPSGHPQQFWYTIATRHWAAQDLTIDPGAPLVGSNSALTSWVQSDDGPHVVYADASGHLQQLWYTIATRHWAVQDLTRDQGAPLVGSSSALTSWVQSDGPHVVYADPSGHPQQFWYTIATRHWAAQDLTIDPGAPLVGSSSALTSWVQSDDGPHVVYADASGHPQQLWYTIATRHWAVQDLTIDPGAPLVGSSSALTSWVESDGPYVVYADANEHVQVLWYTIATNHWAFQEFNIAP